MSKVRSLCMGVILMFVRALARVLELMAVYWLSRCRLWFRHMFSKCMYVCVCWMSKRKKGLFGRQLTDQCCTPNHSADVQHRCLIA